MEFGMKRTPDLPNLFSYGKFTLLFIPLFSLEKQAPFYSTRIRKRKENKGTALVLLYSGVIIRSSQKH